MNGIHSKSKRAAKREGLSVGPIDLLWPSLALAITVAAAVPACALEPTTPLASFARQAWVMENGLPQNTIQALVQTRDGFVWLGTEVGLVRFDGNSFTVFDKTSKPALPGNDVRCLLAADDGALWIGTSEGLARLKGGVTQAFTASDGLPGNEIRSLFIGSSGEVSFTTERATGKIENDRPSIDSSIHEEKMPERLPDSFSRILLSDGSIADANKTTFAVQRAHGSPVRLRVGSELPGTRIQLLKADRSGAIWIGTNGGLARWLGGQVETLPLTDPLAHASVLSLMEDSEGDIWAGTEADGLHILRDQRFRTYGVREGLSSDATSTVVEDATGKLWVGTNGGALSVLRRDAAKAGEAPIYAVRDVLLSNVILSLAAASNGDLWVGTPDGLNRIRGNAVDSFTSADGLPDDFIRSLLADADGSLWIGTRRGLAHWSFQQTRREPARMETFTHADGLGSDLVGAMARDSSGNLWIATLAGLSRLSNGKIDNFTTTDGLSSNVITALLPRSGGTMVVGTQDSGWNLANGRRFQRAAGDGMDETAIHAILDDGLGHLWFATGNGIARCDSSEDRRATADTACANWIEFGAADGLRGRETATNSHPSAWRSGDGLLWFATPKGLVEIDPRHFPVNTVPPPVAIERFAIDDTDNSLGAAAADSWPKVAAGHVHFQFDYAGLSFVAPQKVRYRYRLEGFDHDWTDAGVRRAAYYTNIPPGKYTFRVQAANNDGVWNTAGASLQFELRPHFYQTLWFYTLAVVLAAMMVFLLFRRRLVRAEREFSAVLGERSRIAREIHDTLAQGYVGISVQLEVLAELLRQKKIDAAAKQLDTTRGYVREGLSDARQSIWALRSQDSGEKTLPVRMRRLVEASERNRLRAHFNLFGAYRPLPAETEREFLRVAQEAIHNVNKHARARAMTVRLEYGPAEVALEVNDDGRGFAAGVKAESPAGHFGLTGMNERAESIGGTLEVTSEPGAGTTVRLRVPAPRVDAGREEGN